MNSEFLEKLKADFGDLEFVAGEDFHWSPNSKTIFYAEGFSKSDFESQILHELGHAVSGHFDYSSDIDLLKMELEAWEKAKNLAQNYGVKISQEKIEDHLDTYRDWLHRRSLCPNCHINGFQTSGGTYKCAACELEWQANSAKFGELRRRKMN